jgi:hypothetical protein
MVFTVGRLCPARGYSRLREPSTVDRVGRILDVTDPEATASELAVIAVLLGATGPVDGLDIAATARLRPSIIYPALIRLEQRGWINSRWEHGLRPGGPRRRVYQPDLDRLNTAHIQVEPTPPLGISGSEPQSRRRRFAPGWT